LGWNTIISGENRGSGREKMVIWGSTIGRIIENQCYGRVNLNNMGVEHNDNRGEYWKWQVENGNSE
jgi:hypothetical protein